MSELYHRYTVVQCSLHQAVDFLRLVQVQKRFSVINPDLFPHVVFHLSLLLALCCVHFHYIQHKQRELISRQVRKCDLSAEMNSAPVCVCVCVCVCVWVLVPHAKLKVHHQLIYCTLPYFLFASSDTTTCSYTTLCNNAYILSFCRLSKCGHFLSLVNPKC